MSLLTKVAKGVAFGDVSNYSVRNILTELSKKISGSMTETEMEDTLDFFDWKCPYTGRDLRKSILTKDGTYATDHIYPQNREWCGLNVKGNLVYVDKTANSKKRDKDVKTFLEEDSDYWKKLGVDLATRQERLKKIREFQALAGYDPEKIRDVVKPLMVARYDQIRKDQEAAIATAEAALNAAGIKTLRKPPAAASAPAAKARASKTMPTLVFFPADENQFKEELLVRQKAHFVLTYDSGKQVITAWTANRFAPTSDLRGNITSKTFWRNKDKEGLTSVEVHLD